MQGVPLQTLQLGAAPVKGKSALVNVATTSEGNPNEFEALLQLINQKAEGKGVDLGAIFSKGENKFLEAGNKEEVDLSLLGEIQPEKIAEFEDVTTLTPQSPTTNNQIQPNLIKTKETVTVLPDGRVITKSEPKIAELKNEVEKSVPKSSKPIVVKMSDGEKGLIADSKYESKESLLEIHDEPTMPHSQDAKPKTKHVVADNYKRQSIFETRPMFSANEKMDEINLKKMESQKGDEIRFAADEQNQVFQKKNNFLNQIRSNPYAEHNSGERVIKQRPEFFVESKKAKGISEVAQKGEGQELFNNVENAKAQLGTTLNQPQMTSSPVLDLRGQKVNTNIELVNNISNYLEQNQIANQKHVEVLVKHETLGDFTVKASRVGARGEKVEIEIAGATERGAEFFVRNEATLAKALADSGISVSDIKVGIGHDSKSESTSKDMNFSQNREQSQYRGQERGDSSRNQDSRRREELWKMFSERGAA